MKSKILYSYLFLFIFFADTYLVVSWLRPITLLNYILLLYYFSGPKKKLPVQIIKFKNLFYVFTIFIFLVDFYQNDKLEAVGRIITLLPIPYVFYLFYTSRDNSNLVYFYARIYLLYNGLFSVLQFLGFYYTAGDILAYIPLIEVDQGFALDRMNQGLRISGAAFSSIGFACNLGIIFCYFYFNETKLYSRKARLIYLIVLIFLMLLSQTRSLLFAIIPVIFITNNILSRNKIKILILSSLGFIIIGILIINILPFLETQFPRLFLSIEEDGSVIHRIQANVYGVLGTFYMSPLIGVPTEQALEAINIGYKKLGLFIGERFIDEVTEHNQPAFFLRYYGLIGFSLFMLIYAKFFRIAFLKLNDFKTKKVLLSIIIFYFLYTLSHNNKITMDIYLYIFLALNQKFYKTKLIRRND